MRRRITACVLIWVFCLADGVSNSGSGNHSRQNSRDKTSGSHSRQNSKDGSQSGPVHSRQNSREGLAGRSRHNSRENLLSAAAAQAAAQAAQTMPPAAPASADKPTSKTIQIYGTLPKSKKSPTVVTRTNSGSGSSSSGSPAAKSRFEDEEYILYDRPGRESRFSRNKKTEEKEKVREKRTRSEERVNVAKNVPKVEEPKEKEKEKKKQHKIRRKLLMGGLIRRKNRSMPDLREDENNSGAGQTATLPAKVTLDESALSLNGYLSEGHLEYSGNPNLERSRLMRKSFHGSAGKVLHAAKVPPPPPLRTTSQLSASNRRPQLPLPQEKDNFHSAFRPDSSSTIASAYRYEAAQYANGGVLLNQQDWRPQSPEQASELLVTKAQIHCEASDVGQSLDLPPYPSPAASTCHSRQASDEFPPPPSPSDLSRLTNNGGLVNQIAEKRQQIQAAAPRREVEPAVEPAGDNWLRELQTRLKDVSVASYDDPVKSSVRDLASQFESRPADRPAELRLPQPSPIDLRSPSAPVDGRQGDARSQTSTPQPGVPEPRAAAEPRTAPEQRTATAAEEHEPKPEESPGPGILTKSKSSTSLRSLGLEGKKKKNVTFCDQVVLVATADDEETDDYIPNPILERVLRGAFHSKKDSSYSAPPQREIRSLKDEAPIADSVQTKLDMQRAEQKQLAINNQESHNHNQPSRTTNVPVPVRLPVQRAVPSKVYQPPPHMYQSRPPYNPPPQYHTNSQPSYQTPSQLYPANSQAPYQNGGGAQAPYQTNSYPPTSQPSYPTSSQSYQPSPQPAYQSSSQQCYQPSSQPPYQPPPQQPYQPYQSNSQPSYQTPSQPAYQSVPQSPYQPPAPSPYQPVPQPPYQSVPQSPYQPVPHSPYQPVPQTPYQPNGQTPSYPPNSPSPYQPVPQKAANPGPYQSVPQLNVPQNRAPYYHSQNDVVSGPPAYHHPPPALSQGTYTHQRITSSSPVPNGPSAPGPYQHPPAPRQPAAPTSNGSANGSSHACNLCRKKMVASPAIYCVDCDFYMSRFKPKE